MCGYITPIHKSGSTCDPSNYRGITIGDTVGKIVNQILNNRLTSFLIDKDIIRREQIEFVKGCRTSDHMFIIQTIIQKYVKNESKPLYACFVDFKRAFDTVPFHNLFYKLKPASISSRFYNVIKSMYNRTNTWVKINNQRTKCFKSEIGGRQGSNL